MDSSVRQPVRAAAIQRSIAWLRRSIEVPFLEPAMPRRLQKQRLLALLIDAENASSPLTPAVLRRAACYGVLAVKRAYGDWTRPQLRCHEALMRRHAIEAVQRFPVAAGKNACDMALGVDAMDLLHAGVIDGLCIVSSDSDFTTLAIRFRREGLVVIGFGTRQTPEAFVQACSVFIYVEDLTPQE